MAKQEEENDADLRALKDKLKRLEKKQPTDKDELIKHLMERLEQAEQAIEQAEAVIEHERQYRKQMSKELKLKNSELRELVNKEKKKLQDKVHEELELTLQQALKEKISAEERLEECTKLMEEHNMVYQEVDDMFLRQRQDFTTN